MHNHEPPGYACPFCRIAAGGADDLTSQDDVVRRTDRALALVSSRWWPNNPGHVLVVPTTQALCGLPLNEPAAAEERRPHVERLRARLG